MPENGQDFSLTELQRYVGGYIEIVPFHQQRIMICNEDGKRKELPLNLLATEQWVAVYGPTDVLVGDVIICDRRLVK